MISAHCFLGGTLKMKPQGLMTLIGTTCFSPSRSYTDNNCLDRSVKLTIIIRRPNTTCDGYN